MTSPVASRMRGSWGADVNAFLGDVERHMATAVPGDDDVQQEARRVLASGGKRLRPALVYLGCPVDARPGRGSVGSDVLVGMASAVELIHTASLVHDDLLDGAPTRRGIETVTSRSGEGMATAVGDLLYATAFRVLCDLAPQAPRRALRSIVLLADAAVVLASGEALQERQYRQSTLDVEAYLYRCECKTGVLFSVALALGAVGGDAPDEIVTALQRFGMQIGTAFQIIDDVIDCTLREDGEDAGKEPGTDLLDGTVTLPLILASSRNEEVRTAVAGGSIGRVDDVLRAVATTGALDDSRSMAHDMAVAARGDLEPLDDIINLAAFDEIVTRVVSRNA